VGLLQKHNIEVLRLDGTVPHEQRYEVMREFQSVEEGTRKVMLITSRYDGEGLTLHRAATVIIINPEWTPAREEQSWGRAVRVGQSKKVVVYLIRAIDSMDDGCLEKQELKTSKKIGLLDLEIINQEGDGDDNTSSSNEKFRQGTRDAIKKLRTLNKNKCIEMVRERIALLLAMVTNFLPVQGHLR
jgi:superfamily II DNA or RNA helicase